MNLLRSLWMTIVCLTVTAGCGEECETVSVEVCEAWEGTQNIVRNGMWQGTYTADRYWLGTNAIEMDWNSNADSGIYSLYMARESHFWRVPLYRDSDMVNSGALAPGQTNFKVQYKPGEWWYLSGGYSIDGSELVFRGRIRTHGEPVGRFTMRRDRACVAKGSRHQQVCTSSFNGYDYFPLSGTDGVAKEVSVVPELVQVGVSPNPVTTGGSIQLTAGAFPFAQREWEGSIASATDATRVLATWAFTGSGFQEYTAAPTVPGTYHFRVEVRDNHGEDLRVFPFGVTQP